MDYWLAVLGLCLCLVVVGVTCCLVFNVAGFGLLGGCCLMCIGSCFLSGY